MIKSFIVCICLFLCSTLMFSQSNYRNGLIITNSKDTLVGYVDFRSDRINSKVCKFKTQLESQETDYYPGQIYGYRFTDDGKFYVSKKITLETDTQTVFLEFLLQGIKDLYYFAGDYESDGNYFFENPDGSMIRITKSPDKIVDNKIYKDLKYIGKLTYYFRDCMPVATNSSKATFDRESMIKLTKDYHDKMCDTGEKCILFMNDYKKKYVKMSPAIYSGIELNQIFVREFNMPVMNSLSPVLGANIGISSPRIFKPLCYMFDINVSRMVGACDYSNQNTFYYYQYNFSTYKINYSFGLKYCIPVKDINLYLNGKTGKSLLLNMKSRYTENYISMQNEPVSRSYLNRVYPNYSEYDQNYQITNMINNWILGLGIELKTAKDNYIFMEINYHITSKSFDKLNTIQLKAGYRFD